MSRSLLQAAAHALTAWQSRLRAIRPQGDAWLIERHGAELQREAGEVCGAGCIAQGRRLYRLRLKVKEAAAPALRRFVISMCGEALAFMRFAPVASDGWVDVCLCLHSQPRAQDLQLALGALPNVELHAGLAD